jgi:hypothetical protein
VSEFSCYVRRAFSETSQDWRGGKSILVASALGLALAGCSTSVRWMPTNTPPHTLAPRPPNQVELFSSGEPKRDFVEVGLIGVSKKLGNQSEFDLLEDLRAEAGRRGCDAVLLNSENKEASGNASWVTERTNGFRAACVVYP